MANGLSNTKTMIKRQQITTDKCENCIYGEPVEETMAKMMIHCKAKHKNHVYGQRIYCSDFKRKDDD